MATATIALLMVGRKQTLTPDGELSAIRKDPVSGALSVTAEGPEGDEHAYHGHGGPDKAILQFSVERYEEYRRRFESFSADPAGPRRGFGENISAPGMSEENVCIGDRYRIGPPGGLGDGGEPHGRSRRGIVVEVTGPRQPCWKLGYNSGVRELPKIMQDEGSPGWYYRVLEEGSIAPGDEIHLLERPYPDWSVAAFTRRFYGTPLDRQFLADAGELAPLSGELKAVLGARSRSGSVEEWDARLYGD